MIGVDVGIWVGLPLNFIVIIAGPSFFGDLESEFFLECRTDDIWKLCFLCLRVADVGGGISFVGRHLEASLPLSGSC